MKKTLVFSSILFLFAGIAHSSEIEIIKSFLEEGKRIVLNKMNSGMVIRGSIYEVNQNFDAEGYREDKESKKMFLQSDGDIVEEFYEGNRYHADCYLLIRVCYFENANAFNPENSVTCVSKSSCFRDVDIIGGYSLSQFGMLETDRLNWIIDTRKNDVTFQENIYSLIRFAYPIYFDKGDVRVDMWIDAFKEKAEDYFSSCISEDGQFFIFEVKSPSIPENTNIRIICLADQPDKIVSLTRYYSDRSVYFHSIYNYDPSGELKSIEQFKFNTVGMVFDLNDSLKEKCTKYRKIQIEEYCTDRSFSNEHFNPLGYVRAGDEVIDRCNGIYYIDGKEDSVVSLEEKRKQRVIANLKEW